MEFAKRNTTTIAITAGVTATVALGLYFILKRKSSPRSERAPVKPLTEAQENNIYSQIKITYNGRYLSPECCAALAETMKKLGAVDQANLTLENRKLRRANIKDLAKYVSLCEGFSNAQMDIMMQKRLEVLKHFGIPERVWSESFELYLRQQHPALMPKKGESNENEIHPPNILSLEEVRSILKRSPEIGQEELSLISDWKKYVTDPAGIEEILTNRVSDRVFEEFGVEYEDLLKSMQTHGPALMAQKP